MKTKTKLACVTLLLACHGAAVPGLRAQQKLAPVAAQVQADDPALPKLLDELGVAGQNLIKAQQPHEILAASLQQADVLGRIISVSRPADRESWIRNLAECLATAMQDSPENDKRAASRLAQLRADMDRTVPGTELAAFVAYQEIQAEHGRHMVAPNADQTKVQVQWRHMLMGFVNAYPQTDAAAKKVIELALLCEAAGKDSDARRCYQFLLDHQPTCPEAAKAQGAMNRLYLPGKAFAVALPLLKEDRSTDDVFDVRQLRGKVVVVYFWSASESRCLEDLDRLNGLLARGSRGHDWELLCVNCDADPSAALKVVYEHSIAGVQVYQRKGLDGTVSQRLGLFAVPTTMVVGKQGQVVSKNSGMGELKGLVTAHLTDPVGEQSSLGLSTTIRMSAKPYGN